MGIEYLNTESGLSVNVDLPGVKNTDISVEAIDNIINIKAERKTSQSSQKITKSFSVPEGYDLSKIDAELSDGILKISLQQLPNIEKEVKKIEVKVK